MEKRPEICEVILLQIKTLIIYYIPWINLEFGKSFTFMIRSHSHCYHFLHNKVWIHYNKGNLLNLLKSTHNRQTIGNLWGRNMGNLLWVQSLGYMLHGWVNPSIFAVGFDHGLLCKTWPEGLIKQKPRPKAEVFVVTEAWGPCFSHGMGDHDQILL